MSPRRKTVLLIGPDFYAYNESIADGFRKQDLSVTCIDSPTHTPKGLVNRLRIDLPRALRLPDYSEKWKRSFNAYIRSVAEEMKPDYLVVIRGDWIEPQVFRDMPAQRKAVWFQDLARRSGDRHLDLAMIADSVFVFEGSDVDYLVGRGVSAEKTVFLPLGYDENIYNKIVKSGRRDIDVSFVGHLYKPRKKILSELIKRRPNYRVQVWGRYLRYKEVKTWGELGYYRLAHAGRQVYMNRNISSVKVNEVYSRSKVVLNIHHEQSQLGCNPRVFEIMGAGAFQICDHNDYVREHVSSNIVMYSDVDNLIDLLDQYLHDDEARERIASLTAAEAHRFTHAQNLRSMIEMMDRQ